MWGKLKYGKVENRFRMEEKALFLGLYADLTTNRAEFTP